MRNVLCVESLSLRKWDRLRWSGGMELCNKFDAVFIKNGVFEDVFINENLFNKKIYYNKKKLRTKMSKYDVIKKIF